MQAKIRKEWDAYSDTEKQEAVRRLAELKREIQKIPMGDPMDTGYKRIKYVRYADDFLIGVIGSKEDAEKIKSDIGRFFEETLKLEIVCGKRRSSRTVTTKREFLAMTLRYATTVR